MRINDARMIAENAVTRNGTLVVPNGITPTLRIELDYSEIEEETNDV